MKHNLFFLTIFGMSLGLISSPSVKADEATIGAGPVLSTGSGGTRTGGQVEGVFRTDHFDVLELKGSVGAASKSGIIGHLGVLMEAPIREGNTYGAGLSMEATPTRVDVEGNLRLEQRHKSKSVTERDYVSLSPFGLHKNRIEGLLAYTPSVTLGLELQILKMLDLGIKCRAALMLPRTDGAGKDKATGKSNVSPQSYADASKLISAEAFAKLRLQDWYLKGAILYDQENGQKYVIQEKRPESDQLERAGFYNQNIGVVVTAGRSF